MKWIILMISLQCNVLPGHLGPGIYVEVVVIHATTQTRAHRHGNGKGGCSLNPGAVSTPHKRCTCIQPSVRCKGVIPQSKPLSSIAPLSRCDAHISIVGALISGQGSAWTPNTKQTMVCVLAIWATVAHPWDCPWPCCHVTYILSSFDTDNEDQEHRTRAVGLEMLWPSRLAITIHPFSKSLNSNCSLVT